MSLTVEQSDTAIRETFHNMEEGVEYVLSDFWFRETNRVREESNYTLQKDKREHKFTRKGDQLFVNNKFIFDFFGKSNLTFTFPFAFGGFAFAAVAAVRAALQHNGLEKLNKDTCEGKVVEIDGKKYKLTLV